MSEVVERKAASRWVIAAGSLGLSLVQGICAWVLVLSGWRTLIGLGALAELAGLRRPSSGFHSDWLRIPILLLAVGGSVANLYMVWRVRSLRARPSSQWRMQPVDKRVLWQERIQIFLAVLTLVIVAVEQIGHLIVHNA